MVDYLHSLGHKIVQRLKLTSLEEILEYYYEVHLHFTEVVKYLYINIF